MITIKEIENDITQEFVQLNTIDEKYIHLFKLGQSLPDMDPSFKTEAYQVKGCQSTVWFHITSEDGCMHLEADSDSMVIKGISALLMRLVKDRQPDEVLNINLDFLDNFGIWKLASQQNPGLTAILEHIHRHAKDKMPILPLR